MSPRSDFACLSKACRTEDGATVYELPVGATHCPMGHKRLTRIWTPPHVSTGLARKVDAALEPSYVVQQERRDAAASSPSFAVPVRNLGAELGKYGASLTSKPGQARPTPSLSDPTLAGVRAVGAGLPRPLLLDPKMDHDKRWKSTA
jgi:hypothetical protein